MVRKKIFMIRSDYDHFRFLLPVAGVKENELLNDLDSSVYKGKSVGTDCPRFKYFLFVDPRKKKDKRRMDFNVSCWNVASFICDYETKLKFEEKFGDKVEIFPVDTDLDRDFYFVNFLTIVDSIKDHSVRHGTPLEFIQENIQDEILFRDKLFTSFYYVTEEFIQWVEENDIKGMRFELQGHAE